MHIRQIEKLDIAIEQLEDALTAYFAGRYHSAIVLAGAAEQLLAGYLLKLGGTPAWSQTRVVVTEIANILRAKDGIAPTTEDKIGDVLNHAYNNSKHAGKSDHCVYMDPQFEAHAVIDRTISNYDLLFERGLRVKGVPLAQRFRMESVSRVGGNERNAG